MTPERELELILSAASWLQTTPKSQRPKPSVVELRERFGLRAKEALLAIRYSNNFEAKQGVASNDNIRL